MRNIGIVGALILGSALVHSACGDDDETTPPVANVDASIAEAGAGDSTVTSDAATTDTGTSDTSTPDTSTPDTGTDAEIDGGLDAGLGIELYSHHAGKLVRIHPDTAALTVIGATGQTDMRLIWDPVAGQMRAVVDALTAPKLATVDRCTGTVTVGARLFRSLDGGADGGPVDKIECFARNPISGEYFGSADWNASPSPTSEALVKLDIDGGTAARIGGNIQTHDDDCDSAAFVAAQFYGFDVNTTSNRSGLYRFDLTDAGTVLVGNVSDDIERIGYEATRATMFGIDRPGRTLVRIDLADAGVSNVGTFVTDAGAGAIFDSIAAAPVPVCP